MVSTTESRRHPRARVRLPVRVRWRGPLGLHAEVAQTVDLSRNGVLVPYSDSWCESTQFWVTLPYDASDTTGLQPEMPARLARTAHATSGAKLAALELRLPHPGIRPKPDERRFSPRLPFALPITIRRDGAYWPESSMTIDLSYVGVRFEAARFYALDDFVYVHIPSGSWAERGEIPGRVLRIDPFRGALASTAIALNVPPAESEPLKSVAVVWRPVM